MDAEKFRVFLDTYIQQGDFKGACRKAELDPLDVMAATNEPKSMYQKFFEWAQAILFLDKFHTLLKKVRPTTKDIEIILKYFDPHRLRKSLQSLAITAAKGGEVKILVYAGQEMQQYLPEHFQVEQPKQVTQTTQLLEKPARQKDVPQDPIRPVERLLIPQHYNFALYGGEVNDSELMPVW